MPVLRKYKRKPGYYVKARHNNRMTTYQVSAEGLKQFENQGYVDGSTISIGTLIDFRSRNWLYTGSSGAGYVEPAKPPKEKPPITKTKRYQSNKDLYSNSINQPKITPSDLYVREITRPINGHNDRYSITDCLFAAILLLVGFLLVAAFLYQIFFR